MPTYVYECEECHRRFELLQSLNDPPARECEACGGPIRRVITGGAGVMVKGSEAPRSRCSFAERRVTCCGRDTRCDSPSCRD
jgi:putative FmdB family regulatory protein